MSDQKELMNSINNGIEGDMELSPIPDKLYFSIGEVAELCDLKAHVLRYWEQEFPQLSPSKRRGNRRYYQRKDLLMVRQIKSLLYKKGYTIEGARLHLEGEDSQTIRALQHSHVKLQSAIAQLEKILEEFEAGGVVRT